MTHPYATEYDAEARARRQDAATEAAQHRHDAIRGVDPEAGGEIAMLQNALSGDLSVYTAAGVRTMQTRLAWLQAARGFVPTRVGGE
jgi:hypothetical protein